MPHLTVDYSPNLEDHVDIAGLCDVLRLAAIKTKAMPTPGIRVRAIRADHVSIADGDAKHGYIDVSIRLRGGRDLATRQAATSDIFAAAKTFLEPVLAQHSIALSMEMRDIDPSLAPKYSTIREHLKQGPN